MPVFNPEQLAIWSGGRWDPHPPAIVAGVSNDTRRIPPGALYVAIAGENFDGHAFVEDAFDKGAAGAMVADDSGVPGEPDRPVLRVDAPVAALGRMANAYRNNVDPVMIGVTGSVGKSTVKEMTASILSEAMPTARTRGNWNNEIGLPLSLLEMDVESRAGVFEVGMNHPGEIRQLSQVLQPDWGIVTTIGPVHIEFFESIDAIAQEKAELLRALPEEGRAVLCCDDPFFDLLRRNAPCPVCTVSLSGDADYVVEYTSTSQSLAIHEASGGETQTTAWPWPGRHNALNAGYAVAVARGMGMDWDAVVRGLGRYRPLPMRWDIEDAGGVQIINDAYNANPLSMRAALSAFEETPVPGAKWLVLGDMRELGAHAESEHIALGEFVASGQWRGVVAVGALGALIAEGARRCGCDDGQIWCCADSAEAASVLRGEVHPGDAVFLKASRGVALEGVVSGLKE
jgi:UDP-N-acetylmuramoyl-tripeptide--D-alanyl-D-alanine ligase